MTLEPAGRSGQAGASPGRAQPPFKTQTRYKITRSLMRPAFRLLFHLLSDVKLIGRENVPKYGPYLIAINHVSLFEPPFVLAFWPVATEAAGAVEIWERPGQDILARLYGGIQVHRGEYDRQVVDKMVAVLKAGKPLLLAPEGGRTHTLGMRQALPGVAYLVDQAKVPVVPVAIFGTSDDFLREALRMQRPRLEMRIGKPFNLPQIEGKGEARRVERQRNADRIMLKIAALLPNEYHGVYSDMKDDFSDAG